MGYTPCHQPMSKSVSLDVRVNGQLESRMREIRQSGCMSKRELECSAGE